MGGGWWWQWIGKLGNREGCRTRNYFRNKYVEGIRFYLRERYAGGQRIEESKDVKKETLTKREEKRRKRVKER